MDGRSNPPLISGLCTAILPFLILVIAAQFRPGATHALSASARASETAGIRSISTSQALFVDTGEVDAGNVPMGNQVHHQVEVRNVSGRTIVINVELHDLPGWTATVDQRRLEPGESTPVHLTGAPGNPGEVKGYAEISGMSGFLSLRVAVKGQILVPPSCPGPSSPEAGTPGDPGEGDGQCAAESGEEPAVVEQAVEEPAVVDPPVEEPVAVPSQKEG